MATLEDRKAQAQLGNAKEQEIHHLRDKKGEKISLKNEDIKPEATLYIKGCEDTEIEFNAKCTKIMIEQCRRCKFNLKGRILTNIVEIWKCADVGANISADIRTLQLDICRNLTLSFASRDHVNNVIWAGVYNMSISFVDEPDTPAFVSGFDQMKVQYTDLNPIHDQFIVRIINKEIVSEQVVRLANGYPTTEREAQAFDNQKEQNEKNAEEFIKKRLADAGISLGRKKTDEPKVKPNEKCKCGSGKKAKKCCAAPA
jgi:hypothetical protein